MQIEQTVAFLKTRWFPLGLLGIFLLTLGDVTGSLSGMGMWLKTHHGAKVTVWLIFFLSGLALKKEQIKAGVSDIQGVLLALFIIFIIAPLAAWCLGRIDMSAGIKIGLFLVAVMPTTLSSGVVMTGASGGNIAHALLITIVANGLSMFTIPFSLTLLLKEGGDGNAISLDSLKMMIEIGILVLVPLFLGLVLGSIKKGRWAGKQKHVSIINQFMILMIVWMALSGARGTVLEGGLRIFTIVAIAFVFHGILLAAAFAISRLFNRGRGRRESIIFMGGQKTLPLSVLLQVTLFPQYGLALAFCVVHHLVHLIMDGYLVGRLAQGAEREGR